MSFEGKSEEKYSEPTTIKALVKHCRERDIEISRKFGEIQAEQAKAIDEKTLERILEKTLDSKLEKIMESKLEGILGNPMDRLEKKEPAGPPEPPADSINPPAQPLFNPKLHALADAEQNSPPLAKRPTYLPPFRPRPKTAKPPLFFTPLFPPQNPSEITADPPPSRVEPSYDNVTNSADFKCFFFRKQMQISRLLPGYQTVG
ncbi:hypothetical protein K3495_g9225 [Podosphaera aphanis]|nr:hypothetical protein K3495_g9225 [Podosphaera aphanis]